MCALAFAAALCRTVCISYVAGGGDGGDEEIAVLPCSCLLCLRAFACAAVFGGVEYAGVGGCVVAGGVPVRGGEFVPVHGGYVSYSMRDLCVCLSRLDGGVVGGAGMPGGMVDDDRGVSAARVGVLWFGVCSVPVLGWDRSTGQT